MKKFLQNFQISKIDDFHSKSLNFAENHRSEILSHRAPEDTIRKDFVHTFTFISQVVRQKYLHTSGTPYVSAKNPISTFFPLSQHIAKLLKKYSVKTFPIYLTLFFSKSPKKVGFLKKKVCPNPTHTTLCSSVPNWDRWEEVLEEKQAFQALRTTGRPLTPKYSITVGWVPKNIFCKKLKIDHFYWH